MFLVLLAAMLASQLQDRAPDGAAAAGSHYQQGLAAERRNDLNAARAEYENAVRLESVDWPWPTIGSASCSAGSARTADALAAFERAVRLAPDLFDAQYHLGATRWWTKDLDGALTALEAAVRLRADPRRGPLLSRADAQAERTARRRDRAASRGGARRTRAGSVQLAARRRAAGGRRLDGAVESLKTAVRLDPASVDAQNSLGLALMQNGAAEEAIADVPRRSSRSHPSHVTARVNLGTALMQRGDLAAAVDGAQKASQLQPESAEARYNLGLALKQQDEFAAAEIELRRATELDPNLPEAFYTLGVVLWQTGRADDAVSAFRTAIARRREYADAHFMLGTILRQQGATSDALAEFRATIAYLPTSAEAHLSLGQLLTQMGQTDAATAALAEAERLNARKADAQASTFAVAVGLERIKANDLTGAIERFREAIRLAPENPRAHYQLGLALQRTGRESRSARAFRRGASGSLRI